jgi:hypothetical protein
MKPELYRDIFIGLFFFAALLKLMTGDFALATTLLGLAALSSNLGLMRN